MKSKSNVERTNIRSDGRELRQRKTEGNNSLYYLKEKNVSKVTGIEINIMKRERFNGTGMPYIKRKKNILYLLDNVVEHINFRWVDPEVKQQSIA